MHGGFMRKPFESHKDWPPATAKLAELRAEIVEAFMSGDLDRFAQCNVKLHAWLEATGNADKGMSEKGKASRLKHMEEYWRKRREKTVSAGTPGSD